MNRDALRELAVFTLLVALGVVGRWAQPTWNFTPLAAVTMMGGFYFRNWLPAVLLPVGVLAISDLLLTPHDSYAVLLSVHLMMLVPLLLGRKLRDKNRSRTAVAMAYGVIPATAFFLVTNFAVWAFQSYYPHTLAGLGECYAMGIPFYRTMLAGDLLYTGVLFGSLSLVESFTSLRYGQRSEAVS